MKNLKIRVPDVPAYMATPKACGANPTPIAFAEVYLALQNGTVEAQENPLTTIEAKKFYEVQKAIMMTGHIVDGLTTQIAPHVWSKLTDSEKQMFTEVTREAAARATAQIKKREAELVDEFKKKGLQIVAVNRQELRRCGAEELDAGIDGLRPQGLRPHRRDQVAQRQGRGPRCGPRRQSGGGMPAPVRGMVGRPRNAAAGRLRPRKETG